MIKFRDELKVGDIIIAYKTNNIVALVGEIIGEYEFNKNNKNGKPISKDGIDHQHQRKVKWYNKPKNFDRSLFPKELSKKVALRGTLHILDDNIDVNELRKILNLI